MGGSVPDMPGTRAEGDLLDTMRHEVAQLLHRQQLGFPGAQPVSFASRHLLELQKQDYYVCEKSDGIRCLMYLTEDGHGKQVVYLIDRKNDYYFVPDLHFPKHMEQERERDIHTGTLIDGELVNDTQRDGSVQLRYLVFDLMVLDDNSLMHRTLDKRLAYFTERINGPYKALLKRYPEETRFAPFLVDLKDMEFAYGCAKMFHAILPKLAHGNDGLIFTCRNTPYQSGTDPHILKWKPKEDNSVDFRLFFEWPMVQPDAEDLANGDTEPYPDYYQKPIFHLAVNMGKDGDVPHGTMTVDDDGWEDMKAIGEPLDERIVECFQDEQQQWRFLRWRNDKNEPNYITTVDSVMDSIRDSVTMEQLIVNDKPVREAYKKRQTPEALRAKAEAEKAMAAAQRAPNGHAQTNGHREVSLKRKFEEGDEGGNEETKKVRAP